MKRCDHFKDLILTDYIDGQVDQKTKEEVENHLLDCGDCRVFFKEVKANAVLAQPESLCREVPGALWDNVRQAIEQQTESVNPLEEFIERLKGLLVVPRLVPVLASMALMMVVGTVSLNTIQVQQSQAMDQGAYVVSLLGPSGASATAESELGTPMEQYFL